MAQTNPRQTRYQRDVANYYGYLNWMRRQQDLEAMGIAWDGAYTTDGIPRDLSGKPFEPLDWTSIHKQEQSNGSNESDEYD